MVSARRHPATPNSDILDAVLRGLASCRGPDSSGWYTALCPFHTDQRHPNLRVNERGFRCMACGRKGPLHDLAERLGIGVERHEAKEIASAYDYQDAEGKLLFQVVRYRNPKSFSQRRPDGKGGWIWKLDGVERVLYRLPELLGAELGKVVFVVEGEKDVDRLIGLGLAATTNPHGAGKWSAPHSEYMRGRTVVVIPDNDDPGRSHADQVARSLHGIAAEVRIVELPGLPEKGDVSDWLDAGGTAEGLRKLASAPSAATPTSAAAPAVGGRRRARPVIIVTERYLHEIAEAAWKALLGQSDGVEYFRHGLAVARVDRGDRNQALIQHQSIASMRGRVDRSADWKRATLDGLKPARPPKDVIEDMLAIPCELPVLRGIVGTPVFSSDGLIDTTPGYQRATGLFYDPLGEPIPPVPSTPDDTDLKRAKAIVGQDWLCDFPFEDDASFAHVLAIPITAIAREMIPGPTPLFALDTPTPGTGKGMIASGVGMIVTGREPAVMTETRGEEERKRITALVKAGHPLILLDNVKRRLESGTLAGLLTATYWSDRLLGKTEDVELPVRGVWMATGNNLQLDSDIARRTVWVRLDAKIDRPWERTVFRQPKLAQWVTRHRHELVWAFLVLIQNWIAKGRPEWEGRPLGSYEEWSAVVGGVIQTAGIAGFLENQEQLYERADSETAEWRSFTRRWLIEHNTEAVKSNVLLSLAQDLLPSVFEGAKDNASDRSQLIRLGKALAQRCDRRYAGLCIRSAGEDSHSGGKLWRIEDGGMSAVPATPPSADIPQHNRSTPNTNAEDAECAEYVSGIDATFLGPDLDGGELFTTWKDTPHTPHTPQTDSNQAPDSAECVRMIDPATADVPRCRVCRRSMSVVRVSDVCGYCRAWRKAEVAALEATP